ncbi:hypothetical protein BN1723_010829 [Verticillium longisporum]|uniref:Uncharacterized protein n=1 Tax=Verticillium longisporum TaxID=100787 RepID=A0A0G4L1L9_VERLO|nr:hypothetical protein BN1723_010829 [Verticillium longisporum]CRK23030.1 hypothetical protein BN1708_013592 [Verticillium longisporum]
MKDMLTIQPSSLLRHSVLTTPTKQGPAIFRFLSIAHAPDDTPTSAARAKDLKSTQTRPFVLRPCSPLPLFPCTSAEDAGRTFRNLSSRMRIGVGIGIIGWGLAGHYLADRAEETYKAPAEDKAVVDRYVPRVTVVDRREGQ